MESFFFNLKILCPQKAQSQIVLINSIDSHRKSSGSPLYVFFVILYASFYLVFSFLIYKGISSSFALNSLTPQNAKNEWKCSATIWAPRLYANCDQTLFCNNANLIHANCVTHVPFQANSFTITLIQHTLIQHTLNVPHLSLSSLSSSLLPIIIDANHKWEFMLLLGSKCYIWKKGLWANN